MTYKPAWEHPYLRQGFFSDGLPSGRRGCESQRSGRSALFIHPLAGGLFFFQALLQVLQLVIKSDLDLSQVFLFPSGLEGVLSEDVEGLFGHFIEGLLDVPLQRLGV